MVDLECMVKSLRLAWLKSFFQWDQWNVEKLPTTHSELRWGIVLF